MNKEQFPLTKESKIVLTEYHRACREKRTADRIKAILLLDKGYSYLQIQEILMIDERTVKRYLKLFIEKGIDGLTENNYQGGVYKLSEDQVKKLKEELDSKIYSTATEVCEYVLKSFKIKYTTTGMVKTLHRIGYSYKKTSPIPGKHDRSKQEEFVQKYEDELKSLPDNEKVYFVDGCHPTYNNHFGYGWIKTGSDFYMKTQDGRKHLNMMGAYCPKDQETVIKDYETINGEAIKDFMKALREKNKGMKIHIILDNARYHHANCVKNFVKDDGNIKLHYLPAYSPNLNLIERYWGYLRKAILVNKYYSTFTEFREAILKFSRSKSKRLMESLKKYIPERFHLYPSMAS